MGGLLGRIRLLFGRGKPKLDDEGPEMPTVEFVLQKLRESVGLLAAPWDVQVASVEPYFSAAEEMAFDLDYAWGLRWVLDENGLLDPEIAQSIDAIDATLVEISGRHNAYYWTDEALRDHPVWEEIRGRARVILEGLERIEVGGGVASP